MSKVDKIADQLKKNFNGVMSSIEIGFLIDHCRKLEKVAEAARELCGAWPTTIKPEDAFTVYYDGNMTCNHDFSPHHSGLAEALKALGEE